MLSLRILPTALVLLAIAPAPRAAQPAAADRVITGDVRTPEGSPASQGDVMLMSSPTSRVTAAIDKTGHFRIVADKDGWQRLFISVPGYAPYRANVTVPPSRIMALPAITLLDPTYFHARFATADGEPLASGGLRRLSIDSDGMTIPDELGHVREQVEPDGSITIGPLAPGRTLMAFDRLPLAKTRLRDVNVTGKKQVIEGGTITIASGGQLHVEILDADGPPVPRHEVSIEEAIQPSPLSFLAVRTNEQGQAVFDRLGPGRYRVWTQTADRCGRSNQLLSISRPVAIGGSGVSQMRLVIGGRAVFRITSPLGPVTGRGIVATPDAPPQSPWQPRFAAFGPRRLPIGLTAPPGCGGATDADGRVVLTPFPPGQAQVRVILFNSAYIANVTIPDGGREVTIAVPDGLIPVKVTDRIDQQPVQAQLVWLGGGARVETAANANGDALLEAVGTGGGTLTISARDHQTLEGKFDETPGTQQEVSLVPLPSAMLSVRVVNSAGDALAGAVVELVPRTPSDAADFAAAGATGVATFTDVPPGPLQFSAHADGFAPATVRVAEEGRASIVITLTRVQ